MKIAVLGAGNGGIAVAADWSMHGHDVYLYDFVDFPVQINAVAEASGIHCQGDLEGFAQIAYSGHDIKLVLKDADLIIAVGPAYSTEPLAIACKPFVKSGQKFIVCPAYCMGALVFKKTLGNDLDDDSVVVADTSTLPYACRLIGPAKIRIYLKLKAGLFLAAIPTNKTFEMNALFSQVYSSKPAENILQTTLQNGNPVIHPTVTLLNAGRIESTEGAFQFYHDGVTPGVGRLMEQIDNERIAVGQKLGLNIIADSKLGIQQGYMDSADYETGYRTAKGFAGIQAQSSLNHRYFNEDVGYGLVFISDLGKAYGVETPVIDSVILLASKIMETDYRKKNPYRFETIQSDIQAILTSST